MPSSPKLTSVTVGFVVRFSFFFSRRFPYPGERVPAHTLGPNALLKHSELHIHSIARMFGVCEKLLFLLLIPRLLIPASDKGSQELLLTDADRRSNLA